MEETLSASIGHILRFTVDGRILKYIPYMALWQHNIYSGWYKNIPLTSKLDQIGYCSQMICPWLRQMKVEGTVSFMFQKSGQPVDVHAQIKIHPK